jgi:hypothetical protein
MSYWVSNGLFPEEKHLVDYQAIEIEFEVADGRKVVLRGMPNDTLRTISAKQMQGIFRHGDVSYAVKCLINAEKPSNNSHQYHIDTTESFGKHLQGDRLTKYLSTLVNWKREPNL